MPLESAQYIDTLQPDWPLGTDPESAGDDHMRMIKQVLQNTFPAINGAVSGTPAQLNALTAGFAWQAADPDGITFPFWKTLPGDAANTDPALLAVQSPSLDDLKQASNLAITYTTIQNLIYPVHSILLSSNSANPNSYLGFGTWQSRVGYLAGVGACTDSAGLAANIAAGYRGGNWRVQNGHIVAATLSLTGGATNSTGGHTHTVPTTGNDQGGSGGITPTAKGSGTSSVTTSSTGAHTHTVTGSVALGSGSKTSGSVFQLPYEGVYVWERTA